MKYNIRLIITFIILSYFSIYEIIVFCEIINTDPLVNEEIFEKILETIEEDVRKKEENSKIVVTNDYYIFVENKNIDAILTITVVLCFALLVGYLDRNL